MKISVVILTFNEESNIRDCLESVTWADEIVIMDSYSTDKTVEYAQIYTKVVYQQKWLGYSKQRNLALEKASGEWILVLDADERVSPQLKENIQKIISESDAYEGYYITRHNYFLGKHLKSSPDSHIRLFKNGAGNYCEREVHEVAVIQGRIGHLDGNIIHYTYRNLEQYVQKLNGYSSLGAKEMLKVKKSFSVIDLVFRPLISFIKHYLLKRGFTDGIPGLIFSVSYAYYTFTKYAKLYELQVDEN